LEHKLTLAVERIPLFDMSLGYAYR
jgi:hypothetical protein